MSFPDWGDVPTWTGAGMAAAAFAAAFGLFRVESNRDGRAEADARQAQASLVTAWVEEREFHRGLAGVTQVASLRNGSNACVYDLVLTFHAGGENCGTYALDVLPPRATETDVEIPAHIISHWRTAKHQRDDANVLRVGMTFRDSTNRQWRRRPDGTLEPFGASDPEPRWWQVWRR